MTISPKQGVHVSALWWIDACVCIRSVVPNSSTTTHLVLHGGSWHCWPEWFPGHLQRLLPGYHGPATHSVGLLGPQNGQKIQSKATSDHSYFWKLEVVFGCFCRPLWGPWRLVEWVASLGWSGRGLWISPVSHSGQQCHWSGNLPSGMASI